MTPELFAEYRVPHTREDTLILVDKLANKIADKFLRDNMVKLVPVKERY